jgi:hypothetical protein
MVHPDPEAIAQPVVRPGAATAFRVRLVALADTALVGAVRAGAAFADPAFADPAFADPAFADAVGAVVALARARRPSAATDLVGTGPVDSTGFRNCPV